ncbi:protein-methionine-sulfoxide reductase catalytic subunit MsrP [Luteimonas sp. MC1750]|uniref:protein-methionine-sulfoxide reductase catalytic subunit MsrP n=1 Tax=Luteimonas sp. MC1750 TaxID=2799326 RepID=UPI0018F07F8A|nr:protein-methionine-sulfoxide reductase catalytic subunit MsrP [Luteimonas sp. MC1750]MBJ6984758.1 protein-methionine-sulfoxide reductase catalytic subunit MsrP [Luteimonas sp. MC1750]QQO07137.1 protein-methionine-sulfoxide reductase catalytic subunit MsrP [Luteimonas sp. MC1750]
MARSRLPPVPESAITGEAVYRDRRRLLKALALAPALTVAGCRGEPPPPVDVPRATAAARSGGFGTDEARTRYEDATSYNNFYEFGSGKADPSRAAKTLVTSPWSVAVGGACAKPGTVPLETLLKGLVPEERVYRMRCVEGWSMVIPWLGVPLADVLRRFEPTSDAKFVAFTTLADPRQMPGIRAPIIDWPYREGLRIDEAMHPLTLLATGMYGRALPQQNGAPLRLVVPWKYGFKGIKSIVAIEFLRKAPPTSWNDMQPREYGFFANVNPAVDHPRWSQATERRIAGDANRLFADRIPTRPFNGYADQVASLYQGMDLARWY